MSLVVFYSVYGMFLLFLFCLYFVIDPSTVIFFV